MSTSNVHMSSSSKSAWRISRWKCSLVSSCIKWSSRKRTWQFVQVTIAVTSTWLKNGWTCALKLWVLPAIRFSKWRTTNENSTRHCDGYLRHLARPRPSNSASLNTTKTVVWVWGTMAQIETVLWFQWSDQHNAFKNNISPFQNSVTVKFCRDISWCRRL